MTDLTAGLLINNAASIIGALAALVAAFKTGTLITKANAAKVALDKNLAKTASIHAILTDHLAASTSEPPDAVRVSPTPEKSHEAEEEHSG